MISKKVEHWKRLSTEAGPELPLFDVEIQHMENPRNGTELRALVLKSPDTINVVAITPQYSLVLVEQYRFGIQDTVLELPAGLMEGSESPLETAKRELYEETGYQSDIWIAVGATYLNPAYVNNKCYHFVALQAERKRDPLLDESEDIAVHLIANFDPDNVLKEEILVDAIGVAALTKAGPHLREYLDNPDNDKSS